MSLLEGQAMFGGYGAADILQDCTIAIDKGEVVVVVGPNGAGKSTAMKALFGMLNLRQGSVFFNGEEITSMLPQERVRLGMGFVPQNSNVFTSMTVEENLEMGAFIRRDDYSESIDQVFRLFPALEEKRNQPAGELSGGQRKRVFLARALAQNGQVILLDEPFTGVDVQTEDAIIRLLREMRDEGRIMLVSTHNLGSVPSFCDEVILINQTILAHGSVEKTFTEENLTKAFGGMLRHQHIVAKEIHTDGDQRSVTVLTDDERPLVLYGDEKHQDIVKPEDES